MKKIFVGLLFFVSSACGLLAANSYSLQRGIEAFDNQDYDEAIKYFIKDIDENPKSSLPYYYIAKSLSYKNEYGKALSVLRKGEDLFVSKDSKGPKYELEADIYLELGDTAKAIQLLDEALKVLPKSVDLYIDKAYIYQGLKNDPQSEAMLKKAYSLEPTNAGICGIVANYFNSKKNWAEALKYVDKIEKNQKDTSEFAYAVRAMAYAGLKQYDKATNDILCSMRKSHSKYVFQTICNMDKGGYGILIDSLKKEMERKPKDDYIPFYLGKIYVRLDSLERATFYFMKSLENDAAAGVESSLSDAYIKLGYNDLALEAIDRAIQLDSTDAEVYVSKATALHMMRRENESLAMAEKEVEFRPYGHMAYYRRGIKHYYMKNYDKALEDHNISLDLYPDHAWVLFSRGNVYKGMGKDSLALADYQRVLDLTEKMGKMTDTTDLMMASFYVGKTAEADRWADSLLARNDGWEHMDIALLRLYEDRVDDAVAVIRKAYDKGFRQFDFLYNAPRFAKFKNNAKFKAVMAEYIAKVEQNEAEYRKKYNLHAAKDSVKK